MLTLDGCQACSRWWPVVKDELGAKNVEAIALGDTAGMDRTLKTSLAMALVMAVEAGSKDPPWLFEPNGCGGVKRLGLPGKDGISWVEPRKASCSKPSG